MTTSGPFDFAALETQISPHGEEAMSLQATLQIPASAYSSLDAQQVWTESKRTLERIDEEGLAPRIEHIGAGPFLANVRFAAQQLGEATAHTGASPGAAAPSKLALIEARDRFRGAVIEYTVSLAGDLSTERPGSYERFMAAVAPIDEVREASKRAGEIVSPDGEDEAEDDIEDGDDDVLAEPAPVDPNPPFTE